MQRVIRLIAAVAVAVAPAVIAVAWVRAQRDRLPAELATHWSGRGGPDGFTTREAFATGIGAAAAVTVGITLVWALAWNRAARALVRVIGLAVLAGVSGTIAGLAVMVVVPNLDLVDPATASVGPESALLLPLMLGLPVVTWWVHGRPPRDAGGTARPVDPALPRGTGATAYVETFTPWLLAILLFVVVAAIGVLIIAAGLPWVGAELVVLAAGVAWMTRCTIRVREVDGLTLRGGPVSVRVPVHEFAGARVVVSIDPFSEFGGWGLRVVPGATALVTRRGPGVELTRADGRRFVMTSADPEGLAGVLNTLADGRVSGSSAPR
ncbi:hypothetical protein [Haloactinopolyspora sp.]|uniref:hypothetical protein n=1 Tax=Haloactinopolyspora sp. TaxID=1966353 RepID=UPI00260AF8FF|nr:hypothetical protein [Haloactinopolyspora sp.]